MKEMKPVEKLTKRQKVMWTVMMRTLYRDLETCDLDARDLSRARIQCALHDDDRYLAHILGRLRNHRRAHLN